MRTDVKVGLICLFAIVLGVVIYFVAQGNAHPRDAKADSGQTAASGGTGRAAGAAGLTDKAADKAGDKTGEKAAEKAAGPVVAPPVASDSHAGDAMVKGANGAPVTLAQAGGGMVGPPMGGGLVPAPVAAGGASATTQPGAIATPPLLGGERGNGLTGEPTTMPSQVASPFNGGLGGGFGAGGGMGTPRETTGAFGAGSAAATPGDTMRGRAGGRRGGRGTTAGGFGTAAGAGSGTSAGGFGSGMGMPAAGGTSSAGGTTYKVEKGDMFGTIAKKMNVSVAAIEKANPGVDSAHLKIDQVITIPAATAAVGTHGSAAADSPGTVTPPSKVKAAGSATASAGGKITPGSTYKVKKGDTLGSIAQAAYGDRKAWERILRANRGEISDANVITVGMVLRIPS